MTTYDSWIEREEPEDKDALIDCLEREVEWLRELIESAERSGEPKTGFTKNGPGHCPWCGCVESRSRLTTHESKCPAFTPDGKVRSKFL